MIIPPVQRSRQLISFWPQFLLGHFFLNRMAPCRLFCSDNYSIIYTRREYICPGTVGLPPACPKLKARPCPLEHKQPDPGFYFAPRAGCRCYVRGVGTLYNKPKGIKIGPRFPHLKNKKLKTPRKGSIYIYIKYIINYMVYSTLDL